MKGASALKEKKRREITFCPKDSIEKKKNAGVPLKREGEGIGPCHVRGKGREILHKEREK